VEAALHLVNNAIRTDIVMGILLVSYHRKRSAIMPDLKKYPFFLLFHLQLKNSSNVPFNVDYLTFKITDKKVAKRTAIQEQVVWPVRAYNNVQVIGGKRTERMVFTLPKFTLADDKQLVVELHEQQGGRHQTFTVENADLVRARVINELKVK
jgi:conjugative transposon TraN protein